MPRPDALIESRAQALAIGAHRQPPRSAVLLVNLGTPEAPTAPALRRYLKEFLGDRRVVEVPRPLWWLILTLFILPFRAPRSARAYARIWTERGSPLVALSRSLADRLGDHVQRKRPRVEVLLAMNYGRPSIDEALDQLRALNIQRLLVVPLYPQYSATTTASVFDRVTRAMRTMRWLPELRFVNDYYRQEAWVEAISASITGFRQHHGSADILLFSFHGLPRRNLLAGDPYHCQCLASARRIAEHLELPEHAWQVSFQSRFGRAPWLQPYTDQTLHALARRGIRKVQVVCPGFAVDCLETLEEIAIENRELFIKAGGQDLHYIPCLNDSDAQVRLLAELVVLHTQGWPEFAGAQADAHTTIEQRPARIERAAEHIGLD